MTKSEIESWVYEVIKRARQGWNAEDSFSELKSDWGVDFDSRARRLAGLANAARCEPVLWIVGVDDNGNIIGAPKTELANWWPSIQKEFVGPYPILVTDVSIDVEGKNVVALYFEVDNPPYLVRFKADRNHLEVPWRVGTRVVSATHADLLRVLVPTMRLPKIEVLRASLRHLYTDREPGVKFAMNIAFYVIPAQGSTLTLRKSDFKLAFYFGAKAIENYLPPPTSFNDPKSSGGIHDAYQIHILRPCQIEAVWRWGGMEPPEDGENLILKCAIQPVECDKSVRLEDVHLRWHGTTTDSRTWDS